jgi:hypothetical protein
MKQILISVFCLSLATAINSQNIPEGYIMQYQQDFSGKTPLDDFCSDDFHLWSIKSVNGNKYLEYNHDIEVDSSAFIPLNICMIDNYIFGDFIIELNLMQSGEVPGNAIRILFGIKDSLEYYCFSASSVNNEQNEGIFVVENEQPVRVPDTRYKNISWTPGKWHKVRIERNIVDTSVKVFFDDMKKPYMETKDRTFIMGYIGFGSVTGKAAIDNIKIWSQTSIPLPAGFLKRNNEKM